MLKTQNLSGSFNGLATKLSFIMGCYDKSLSDERVRRFAEIAAGKGSRTSQATNLYNALRTHMSYIPDPLGTEMTKSPQVMVDEMEQRGSSIGDCDDHACLSYSMLKSIGIPARLRVVWFDSPMPQHIYTLAFLDGSWVPFDTTRRAGFGTEAPYTRKKDF